MSGSMSRLEISTRAMIGSGSLRAVAIGAAIFCSNLRGHYSEDRWSITGPGGRGHVSAMILKAQARARAPLVVEYRRPVRGSRSLPRYVARVCTAVGRTKGKTVIASVIPRITAGALAFSLAAETTRRRFRGTEEEKERETEGDKNRARNGERERTRENDYTPSRSRQARHPRSGPAFQNSSLITKALQHT